MGNKTTDQKMGVVHVDSTGLLDALDVLSIDMHQASTRGCSTCKALSNVLGKPFGCDALRKRVREREASNPRIGREGKVATRMKPDE